MHTTQPEVPAVAPELAREGFFWCGHCHHVVELEERLVQSALDAPSGSLLRLKCPRCRHHEVEWRLPSRRRPRVVPLVQRPVDPERGAELWAELKRKLAGD